MTPDARTRLQAGGRFLLGLLVVFICELIGESMGDFVPGQRVLVAQVVAHGAVLLLLLAASALLVMGVDKSYEPPLAAIGLGLEAHPLRAAAVGAAIGGAMATLCVVVIAVTGKLSLTLSVTPRTLLRAGAVLVLVILAAMSEEISFHGYPFQRLIEAIGGAGAIVVTSLLFGTAHMINPHATAWSVTNTVLFGALMGLAYLRTRQLWLPIGIHAGWNWFLGFAFGLPLSGFTIFAAVVKGTAEGPATLTGGSYGVEGGALATVASLAGMVAVWRVTHSGALVMVAAPSAEAASNQEAGV